MYNETELMHHLTDIMDDFLEKYPDGLVVCGGDLNRLDIEHVSLISGLKAVVDFPTRGSASSDNCLKQRVFIPQVLRF